MTDFHLTHQILQHNGCNLHYWTSGSPDKPLVILTHGAWIDHTEFEGLLPALADRYRLLLWDVRGHGFSKPADPRFSIQTAMLDLLALMDANQADQAILIGHSMGGNLSQEVVFYHPERVRTLVCVDCTCNTQRLTNIEKFSLKIAFPLFHLYPFALLRRQAADISASTPEAQKQLYKMLAQSSKADYIHILKETSLCLHYEPGYRIEKPLLIIVGDEDKTGNIRKIAPIWANRDKGSTLAIIPKAGHAVNLDQPAEFNQCVISFLNKVIKA